MRAHIAAIGILAPGLANWDEARRVASGASPLVVAPLTPPAPRCLPPAERRRSSVTARLAIAAAEQALEHAAMPAADMRMVFAAAEAAGEVTNQLCEVLAGTREVSPTLFHNSVHNAPLGYLSIATGARRSGTSLCRGDWTFAAGLAHAAIEAQCEDSPVLLVAYDSPMPAPMRDAKPMVEPTALALVLTPQRDARTIASCELAIRGDVAPDPWPAWIPDAWHANPSARGFVAIPSWSVPGAAPVRLPYSERLVLEVRGG